MRIAITRPGCVRSPIKHETLLKLSSHQLFNPQSWTEWRDKKKVSKSQEWKWESSRVWRTNRYHRNRKKEKDWISMFYVNSLETTLLAFSWPEPPKWPQPFNVNALSNAAGSFYQSKKAGWKVFSILHVPNVSCWFQQARTERMQVARCCRCDQDIRRAWTAHKGKDTSSSWRFLRNAGVVVVAVFAVCISTFANFILYLILKLTVR